MLSTKTIRFLLLFLCITTDFTTSLKFKRASQGLTAIPVIDIPTNVDILDLRDNNICNADPFPAYPFLNDINLEKNCLTTFPNFCNVHETLIRLNIGHNDIIKIPEEFIQCLKNLLALKMNDNRLSTYPVVTLVTLTNLNVNNNNFTILPPIRVIAPNAEVVQVSGNPLDPDAILDTMEELGGTLEILALSDLNLSRLDIEKLEQFQHIDWIKLHGNQFLRIPELGFSLKRSVSKLSMNRNPIAIVQPQELREFINLVKIELKDCQITMIPELCQIKPGLVIDLTGNPLVCDCHAKELKMAAEAGVVIVNVAPCQEPAELQDVPLSSIAMDQLNCPTTDILREFAVYKTNPEMFSCEIMKAAITVVDSSSADECSTECISQPTCGGYHFTHDNCSLYEFGINHPDDVTVSRNTYILN